MTNFIPIFPFGSVIYPGEQIDLQITKEAHKQMISECYTAQKSFGIHFMINGNNCEIGTAVAITELTKQYKTGSFNIKIKGIDVFRILEVITKMPEKLYEGAIVSYPRNDMTPHRMMKGMLPVIQQLQELLNIPLDIQKEPEKVLSYDIAHKVGLPVEKEYELLELMQEDQRLEYLRRYLANL